VTDTPQVSGNNEGLVTPSLTRRYFFKLLATFAAAIAGVAVDALGSRALGPASYGQFYYLQQFFWVVFSLLSSSVSLAFVTRASRRPHSHGFTFVYLGWLFAIPILMELAILIASQSGVARLIWPGSAMLYVQLGAIASFLLFLTREGTSMGDSYGLTVPLETIRVIQRVLSVALLVSLFVVHALDLKIFFLYTAGINAALAVALFTALRAHNRLFFPRRPFEIRRLRAAGRYFFDYSAPLMVFLPVAMVSTVFDRWLLQTVAGNTDQGYFSLAYQISQMVLLLVTAFMPLLMREMSIAHGARNHEKLSQVFRRAVTNLYFVACFGACFVVVNSDHFSILMGGKLFLASTVPIAFVVLATLHRTYGQVTSTLYYATGNTRLYRNLAIVTSIGGMALAWVMIAPHQYFGLQLGAVGLAIKTLLTEVMTANIFAIFACRYLGLSYRSLFVHQISCAGVLLGVAQAVRMALSSTLPPSHDFINLVLQTGLSGLLYTLCIGCAVWIFPSLAGVERAWLRRQTERFLLTFRNT
jgi:O-antigen/teichoic acid export membrane protein